MNPQGKKYYSDYTSYPKIFTECYWGNHSTTVERTSENELRALNIIAENRNIFYNEYKIKKYYNRRSERLLDESAIYIENEFDNKYKHDMRDHIEYYKDIYGNIVSLFSCHVSIIPDDKIREIGYTLYIPLYSSGQNTYIKVLPSKKNGIIRKPN